jgi:Ni/Co efflux regulator RcnB
VASIGSNHGGATARRGTGDLRTLHAVSRQKVIYEIARADTGEPLSQHRTRQAAVDNWRRFVGVPVRITRWSRYEDGPGVLIAEGTWHEAQRPDAADPFDE